MEYATRKRVWWFRPQNHRWMVFGFGPQNPGGGSEEERGGTWRNHIGCIEMKQICEGSMAVRSTDLELDHNAPEVKWFGSKYLGANWSCVIAL